MSEIKVNKISPRSGTTVTLGDSGDTFTIPSGATINNQGTATNFGATGAASWTTTVKTTTFTAVAGEGYFVDTNGGAVTVNLPAGSAGAVVAVKDYRNTWDTNACTLAPNGSDKIGGQAASAILNTEGLAVTLVFIDSTRGWLVTDDGLQSNAAIPLYISATGGTVTTVGDFKVHTFTGPGTFCVSSTGNSAGSEAVDYMVIAGGGGGGGDQNNGYGGGGGGAGGYRESPGSLTCYTASPLGAAPAAAITVGASPFPITVGGGGAARPNPNSSGQGTAGSSSSFSTITSAGGGGGGTGPSGNGNDGGSGGGPASNELTDRASGNTPSVTPPQGQPSGLATANGNTSNYYGGVGGGGAGGASPDPNPPSAPTSPNLGGNAGDGGAGTTSSINGTPTARAGGGGGGIFKGGCGPHGYGSGDGGTGGGGNGAAAPASPGTRAAAAGTANTGGGGGGAGSGHACNQPGAAGGSGIVIIRYKFQN